MLIKSDTCLSGWHFKASKWASSTQSPNALNWLLPPWALMQVSPSAQAIWEPFLRSYNPCESCGHKTCWFSKLDVLRLRLGLLSGAGLKSWGCLVCSKPLLLRKKLWVLSLFLTVRVRFLARLWPSFLYPLCCGPSLICQMHRNAQFLGLFQGNLFLM